MSETISNLCNNNRPSVLMIIANQETITNRLNNNIYDHYETNVKTVCIDDSYSYDLNKSTATRLHIYIRKDLNISGINEVMNNTDNIFCAQHDRDNVMALANKLVENGRVHESILFLEKRYIKNILTKMKNMLIKSIPLNIDDPCKIESYINICENALMKFNKLPDILDKNNNLDILIEILDGIYTKFDILKKKKYIPAHIYDYSHAIEFALAEYCYSSKTMVARTWK